MVTFIKTFIKKYITCKHHDYVKLKQIMVHDDTCKPKYFDKCKCNICGREFYSNYYYVYGKECRHIETL